MSENTTVRDLSEFIPKEGNEIHDVEKLKDATDEELKPFTDQLIKWLDNRSYPVTKEVTEILAKHPEIISDSIIKVLDKEQGNEEWKVNVIQELIPKIDGGANEAVVQALIRLVRRPTIEESTDGPCAEAKIYLQSINRY